MGRYKKIKTEAVPSADEPVKKRSTSRNHVANGKNSNTNVSAAKKNCSATSEMPVKPIKSSRSTDIIESSRTRTSARSHGRNFNQENPHQVNSTKLEPLKVLPRSPLKTKVQSKAQPTPKDKRRKTSTKASGNHENSASSCLNEVDLAGSPTVKSIKRSRKKPKTSQKSTTQDLSVKSEKPADKSIKVENSENEDMETEETTQQPDGQNEKIANQSGATLVSSAQSVEDMADATTPKRSKRRASAQKSYKEPQISDEEENIDDTDDDSDFDPTTEIKRSKVDSDSDNEYEPIEQTTDASKQNATKNGKRPASKRNPKLVDGVRKGKERQKPSYSKNQRKSKGNKAAADSDSSSDDGDDWEEVADLPTELFAKNGVEIILGVPKKKKQGYDWKPYFKMIWRRYWRIEHECVHKVELMCLFVHGLRINDVCNEQLMKALTTSLYGKTTLKGKQCTTANITKVLSKLKETVTVEPQPLSQPSINTLTLLDALVEGLHSHILHRADHRVLLVLAVLRALGASARLCMAWYPVPFRVPHYQKQQNLLKAESSESGSASRKMIKEYRKSNPFAADSKKHLDKQIWLEVHCSSVEKWLPVNGKGDVLDDITDIVKNLRKPLTYIVSYDNEGKFKDLTSKYDPNWMIGTKKLRVADEWWEETILPYKVKESKKTKQEDDQLQSQLEKMPFPVTIGGFKDHPLYVLERHLLKFEAIYPRTAVPLGFTKTKEAIYSRRCVVTLNSREMLLKQARQVKEGEEPYKYVKPLPTHKDVKNGVKITAATQPVFGDWQTEPYDPPTAENGKVPRNAFGNVDLFKPQMLPKGCVQLRDPLTPRVCRKLGIDYAQLMVGWMLTKGRNIPQYDGWAVCEEFEEAFLVALDDYKEEEKRKAKAVKERRAYDNWKKLIRGIRIRDRLQLKYGKDM